MPNINLIAARRVEKKRMEQNTRRLFFGLTAEVAALVLLGSYFGARQLTLRGAMADADSQLIRLQPTLDRIAELEKETAGLKPKLETLDSARTDTLRWRAMLQIVSQSVPSNAWLTGITASAGQNGEETVITVAGIAGSQTLVGETMTRLGTYTTVFDKVDLNYTQLASQSDNRVARINFEIGARLRSNRPPEKPQGNTPEGAQETASSAGEARDAKS